MTGPLEILDAIKRKKMIKVKDIAEVIEAFAPKGLQESYDNTGLQVGNPDMPVSAALLCLDITEEILQEAIERHCNMVITHHPLIFKGLKGLTGSTAAERIAIKAICSNVAIYSAHTNLDSAWNGVSHEMAHMLNLKDIRVLEPKSDNPDTGLGVIGEVSPTPTLEFLRKVKEVFGVRALRYSQQWPGIVVKRVAICGGSGASLIRDAVRQGADAMITGDVKYHDYTEEGRKLLIADIGHYEGELCATRIFSRIIREKYPEFIIYFSEKESNPIGIL